MKRRYGWLAVALGLLALLATAKALRAQDAAGNALYWASAGAMTAGTVADYRSSLATGYERNGLLRGRDGRMAPGRGLAIKAGALGGTIALQRLVMRKRPRAGRWFTIVNFGVAAGYGAVVRVNLGNKNRD